MSEERSVLVTGASGMIGRATVDALVRLGWTVHATSRCQIGTGSPQVRWHVVNLLDPAAVQSLLADLRCRYLLHLAWITDPPAYWTSPLNVDWVSASLRLLQDFASNGGQRAVLAGTCAEYDWEGGTLNETTSALRPATPYGRSKLALSMLAQDWAAASGVSVAWGRVFFAFGPFEHPSRLVAAVTRSLLAGQPIACTPCEQVRDLLYAGDVGSAFAHLLGTKAEGTLNVCSGIGVRLADVVNDIGEVIGRRELIRLGELPARVDEPARLVGDASRLRATGWEPSWPLRRGITETIRWWRSHATLRQT